MQHFSVSPAKMISSLWRNRSLIKTLTRREILGRYRGSFFGLFWSFFNPLLMLSVYTFVFSEVLKARWVGGSDSKTEFALALFAGLMVFNLFTECINRAPSLILSNVNYVKKVVFPLEVLPCAVLSAALFHGAISLCVWLAAYSIFYGVPHVTVFYLPLIIIPFIFFILGVSWLLSSLGTYLRDVSQLIGILTTVMMFLSPIFYPATALPENTRYLLYLNPLTPVVEQTRNVLFMGKGPDFIMLGVYWICAIFIAWLGFAWFQKTRKGFADVL
jgi:lipopolysaccharide transport system permease protein